jgi:Mn2+/Fe2+ NRAMP family transporter
MARQLGPLLGGLASGAFALGLFAAGLSSAVTAPLAAAYALTHAMGWQEEKEEERAPRFRALWAAVLLLGLGPVLVGVEPVAAIVAAQALNGLLLPFLAALLLLAAGGRALGRLRNGPLATAAGVLAVLAAAVLGANLLAQALLGP